MKEHFFSTENATAFRLVCVQIVTESWLVEATAGLPLRAEAQLPINQSCRVHHLCGFSTRRILPSQRRLRSDVGIYFEVQSPVEIQQKHEAADAHASFSSSMR